MCNMICAMAQCLVCLSVILVRYVEVA